MQKESISKMKISRTPANVYIVRDDFDQTTVGIVIGAVMSEDAIRVLNESGYKSVGGPPNDLYTVPIYELFHVSYE